MSVATTDLYKFLQVDREALPEVIEVAFRRLSKFYHPDVTSGSDALMKALNVAHDILSDPVSRQRYDMDLARREAATARPRATSARTATATPPSTEGPAPQPATYEPRPAQRDTSTAEPRAPWHEAPRKNGQVQLVLAIIAFLVFVITPLFDHGFPEPFIIRFATGMAVWGVILFVQLVLDAHRWRTTPLGELLRLTGRLLKRLFRILAWVAKALGTRLVGRLRRARRKSPGSRDRLGQVTRP